ncbi:hypothetical protein TNCV_4431851 [Trichonephila clavipes]|nr:hypothetical protein TNCV_4431851 [Trichonephila clavipes]
MDEDILQHQPVADASSSALSNASLDGDAAAEYSLSLGLIRENKYVSSGYPVDSSYELAGRGCDLSNPSSAVFVLRSLRKFIPSKELK